MRVFSTIVIILLTFATGRAVNAENVSCKSNTKFEGGGYQENELTIGLKGDHITKLLYSNTFSDGQEGGAYFCELSLVEGSQNSEWLRSGTNIRINDKEPGDDSYAEIDILPGGDFKVRLGNVSHYHCGFGAEFPESVVLKKSGGECILKMP